MVAINLVKDETKEIVDVAEQNVVDDFEKVVNLFPKVKGMVDLNMENVAKIVVKDVLVLIEHIQVYDTVENHLKVLENVI